MPALYDAVIVGAGVAGALMAERLSAKGKKVVLLEAGPREQDRSLLLERFYAASFRTPESPYPNNALAPRPEVLDLKAYYVQKGPEDFKSTFERRVGGTTWHWLGTCLRLVPEDFKTQSLFDQGCDWPLDYQELEPWYAKAEQEMGVAGDSSPAADSPRSSPYPFPPIAQSHLDRVVGEALQGCVFEGAVLSVKATPQARNPKLCMGSASCIPICPMGAKYEAMTHVLKAEQQGAELRAQAVAYAIDVDAQRRISAIRYYDWDRKEHVVKGRWYILAANAIETAKLLLMSTSPRMPAGVANSSGLVGRHLMDHPVQLSWGLSPKPLYPFRGPLSTSGIDSLRSGPFRKTRAAFRLEIGNDGWSWPTGAPASTVEELSQSGLYGQDLDEALRANVHRQLRLASLVEQRPDPKNYIVPSKDKLDALGLPRPEIHYELGAYERLGLQAAREAHQLVFDRLKAKTVSHHQEFFGAGHIMGTYRMGLDSKTSVVDSYLRSHDHDNLYLLGAGVFPSAGSSNPTLTIAALTLRATEHLLQAMG